MDFALAQESIGLRVVALAAALLPIAVFWAIVLMRKPIIYLREAIGVSFALGAVIAIPISLIGWGLDVVLADMFAPETAATLSAFVAAAVTEEAAKYLVLIYFALRHENMAKPSNAIWFAVAVGLGFAAFENIFYVFDNAEWQVVAGTRAVTAVPSHGFDGLIMGYLVALGLSHPKQRRLWFVLALVLPVVEHGVYDVVIMLGAIAPEASNYSSLLNSSFVALLLAELLIAIILLNQIARSPILHREIGTQIQGTM